MIEALWICAAFFLGFLARQLRLPPLIGYLATGFLLFGIGFESGPVIDEISDAGITLLLFTIGLKLRINSLLRPHVWNTSLVHMAAITFAFGGILYLFPIGLPFPLAALIGFALSYSSTVFAVKVLEEKGEMGSIYGQAAIGVLIIQDLVAVLFIALSTGTWPTPWALLLFISLFPMRWVLFRLMDRAGHEELLILFGLAVALGSYELFELVGIKGDLGALIAGVLLASHKEADGLSKSLMGLKDFFLVGFFISIGLNGLPGLESLMIAVLLVLIMPLKSGLFFLLFSRFNLRSRTSFLSSLALSNYSEFGLIIAVLAVSNGWIPDTWLLTIALALSLSFLVSSPINTASHTLYDRFHDFLLRFEKPTRLPEEQIVEVSDATVLLFGLGRVGSGAYDELAEHANVLGIDMDPDSVLLHNAAGRNVIHASATDSDFWDRLSLEKSHIELVMLAMPQLEENLFATRKLNAKGYTGLIAAIVKYSEDADALREAGVHRVYNFYTEAGAGFAADALEEIAV